MQCHACGGMAAAACCVGCVAPCQRLSSATARTCAGQLASRPSPPPPPLAAGAGPDQGHAGGAAGHACAVSGAAGTAGCRRSLVACSRDARARTLCPLVPHGPPAPPSIPPSLLSYPPPSCPLPQRGGAADLPPGRGGHVPQHHPHQPPAAQQHRHGWAAVGGAGSRGGAGRRRAARCRRWSVFVPASRAAV